MTPSSTPTAHTGRGITLSIWQQNTNKFLISQSKFLHQLDPNTYDLGAVQEPYLDHLHNSCTSRHWYTIYPKEHYTHPAQTRSLLLVNKRIVSNTWSQVDFGSSDITAIWLQTGRGVIMIVNIYVTIFSRAKSSQLCFAHLGSLPLPFLVIELSLGPNQARLCPISPN